MKKTRVRVPNKYASTTVVKAKNGQPGAMAVYTPRGTILIEPCKGFKGTIEVRIDLIEEPAGPETPEAKGVTP